VRWRGGAPADPVANQGRVRQQLSLRLSADKERLLALLNDGASMPTGFAFATMFDTFNYNAGWNQTMMGANWPLRYDPALTGNPVAPTSATSTSTAAK
jgi:hypothetical protein